eukprot:jgi/Ulvmu1/11796/UM080_0007.1
MNPAQLASQGDGILEDRHGASPACLPPSFMPRPTPAATVWSNLDIAKAQSGIADVLGPATFQRLRSILVAQQVEYRCQLHIYQWLLLQQSILAADASSTGSPDFQVPTRMRPTASSTSSGNVPNPNTGREKQLPRHSSSSGSSISAEEPSSGSSTASGSPQCPTGAPSAAVARPSASYRRSTVRAHAGVPACAPRRASAPPWFAPNPAVHAEHASRACSMPAAPPHGGRTLEATPAGGPQVVGWQAGALRAKRIESNPIAHARACASVPIASMQAAVHNVRAACVDLNKITALGGEPSSMPQRAVHAAADSEVYVRRGYPKEGTLCAGGQAHRMPQHVGATGCMQPQPTPVRLAGALQPPPEATPAEAATPTAGPGTPGHPAPLQPLLSHLLATSVLPFGAAPAADQEAATPTAAAAADAGAHRRGLYPTDAPDGGTATALTRKRPLSVGAASSARPARQRTSDSDVAARSGWLPEPLNPSGHGSVGGYARDAATGAMHTMPLTDPGASNNPELGTAAAAAGQHAESQAMHGVRVDPAARPVAAASAQHAATQHADADLPHRPPHREGAPVDAHPAPAADVAPGLAAAEIADGHADAAMLALVMQGMHEGHEARDGSGSGSGSGGIATARSRAGGALDGSGPSCTGAAKADMDAGPNAGNNAHAAPATAGDACGSTRLQGSCSDDKEHAAGLPTVEANGAAAAQRGGPAASGVCGPLLWDTAEAQREAQHDNRPTQAQGAQGHGDGSRRVKSWKGGVMAEALAEWGLSEEVLEWLQQQLPNRGLWEGGGGGGGEDPAGNWALEEVVALLADPELLRLGHSFRDASRANIMQVHTLYHQHHPEGAATAAAAPPPPPPPPGTPLSAAAAVMVAANDAATGHALPAWPEAHDPVGAAMWMAADIVAAAEDSAAGQRSSEAAGESGRRQVMLQQLQSYASRCALANEASCNEEGAADADRPRSIAASYARDAHMEAPCLGRIGSAPDGAAPGAARGPGVGHASMEHASARPTSAVARAASRGRSRCVADTGSGVTGGRGAAEGETACSASPRFAAARSRGSAEASNPGPEGRR